MSLAEMQSCLARLSVQPDLQRLFFQDRRSVLGRYRLSAEEERALAGLDPKQLRLFTAGLIARSRTALAAEYPLFSATDQAGFEAAYDDFFAWHGPPTEENWREQIAEFGALAQRRLTADAAAPAHLTELVRFERQQSLVRQELPHAHRGPQPRFDAASKPHPAAGALIERYRWNMFELAAAVRDGAPIPAPDTKPLFLMIFRRADSPRARALSLNVATRTLIDLCNGGRTAPEIGDALERELCRTGLQPFVERELAKLMDLGALHV